ncbi:hypothetical protein L0668_20435 [Paraglaciecola aquimarina]|uniref:Uncharacterized protein n=1 Tax=Paraglaciecola algarum TaxID=3050085 RepID=A0ABS9DBZ5_9ALTE|nr:hypothetical protein [Paraglaciecola sp. G1-23]MCF2950488.1 hypothetical protein [Paraglaciecola sp. G1-23]
MSAIHRQLIALDMLAQDLIEELDGLCSERVTQQYLALLKQYHIHGLSLADEVETLSDYDFSKWITQHQVCRFLISKKLLLVQNRLVGYVLDYYDASRKSDEIRHSDFSEHADRRFDLLTTKAIKARSQYRTVAKAMNQNDYLKLIEYIGLPLFDWGWEQL